MRQRRAHGHREVERGDLGLEEAAHAPHDGRRRHERKLDLGHDAKRTVAAHEQVEGIHVVGDVVARGVLGVRHLVGGQVEGERAPRLGHKPQRAAVRPRLTAVQRHNVAVGQHHAQGAHVWTHRPVAVAARTGGVAGHHAADAGARLGGVRGEELLGTSIELVKRGEALLVPAVRGHGLVRERLAQVREHHARLHAQAVGAVLATAQAEDRVHAAQVEHVTALGHGARGKARARALHRDGRAARMQLAQHVSHLVLAGGK